MSFTKMVNILQDRIKSTIKVKAYDENADYCYKNLNKNEIIFIYGKLENKNILIKKIIKI